MTGLVDLDGQLVPASAVPAATGEAEFFSGHGSNAAIATTGTT